MSGGQLEWKYIVIDEAQRMKDRESKLAKDLERFITSRRLLLTGARPAPARAARRYVLHVASVALKCICLCSIAN